jgi:hypothetical protein
VPDSNCPPMSLSRRGRAEVAYSVPHGQIAEMALKKILVNPSEDRTFRLLLRQAEGEDAYVCLKVSVKDVLPFENTQLSRELRNFCWTAHFDFVVMTGESEPLFAVEFDGPSHDEPIQEVRDRKKDELCRIFSLPILRINSLYLSPSYRGTELLSWFAECFFLERAFQEAEEKGWISPEDGFDPCCVSAIGDRQNWPLDLSHDIREDFRRLHASGRIFDEQPSFVVGRDKEGTYRAVAFIAVTRDCGVFATTAMRAQQFGNVQAEALEMLICFEIHEALKQVLAGVSEPEPMLAIMERMESYIRQMKPSREASMNSDWTTRSMSISNRWSYF